MNNKNSRKKLIALIFVPIVVACVISGNWSVRSSRAQINDVMISSYSISGGTDPQALEFCLGVKGDFRAEQNTSAEMRIELQSFQGRVVDTQTLSSPRVGFRCTLVRLRDLAGDREPVTGRIDVLVKRTLNVVGMDRSNVVDSMALVNESGEIQVLYPAQPRAGSIQVVMGDGSVRFVSANISPTTFNQALLFCLGIGDLIQKTDASAKMTIQLFNQQGDILLVTDLHVGGSLRSKCMNISNSEIPGEGEIGTLRKQVLVQRTLDLKGIDPSKVVESYEIITLTGATIVRYPG
jgi:hypothetical protein